MSASPTPAEQLLDRIDNLDTARSRDQNRLWRAASWLVGWAWRVLAGTYLCFNFPILSYLTSILVVGWLNRWVRTRTRFAWWNASPVRDEVPWAEVGDTDRRGRPVLRPRWFIPEKGWVPALWLNFRTGLATLLCVYLVLGLGCLVMFFSWEMGWVISFYKGYEDAWIGFTAGAVGSLLLIVGLIYVPMARTHMAVTSDARAFFDARVIWRLIRARLLAYTLLTALVVLLAVVLELYKMAPAFFGNQPPWDSATDAEVLWALRGYFGWTAFVLFLSLLLSHALAARVYRGAILKALRDGTLVPEDLPPRLAGLLARLELLPEPAERKRGLARVLRWTWRWYSYRLLAAALVLLGVAFVAKVYIGEFAQAHPFAGFMNHPLLQFPCVDFIPNDLWEKGSR